MVSLMMRDLLMFELFTVESRIVLLSMFDVSIMLLFTSVEFVMLLDVMESAILYVEKCVTCTDTFFPGVLYPLMLHTSGGQST